MIATLITFDGDDIQLKHVDPVTGDVTAYSEDEMREYRRAQRAWLEDIAAKVLSDAFDSSKISPP